MFPIRALAAPILRTLGGVIVKKNSLTAEEDESAFDMYKYKVLLTQKVTPRHMTLPSGRSF